MTRKVGRLLLVAALCLACTACAIARRSMDRYAVRDVGQDLEKAVVALEGRGYQCLQSSFTPAERSFFEKQQLSPEKLTCHRQAFGLFCVDSDFVDLFSQDGKVITGRAQTVPVCIWH